MLPIGNIPFRQNIADIYIGLYGISIVGIMAWVGVFRSQRSDRWSSGKLLHCSSFIPPPFQHQETLPVYSNRQEKSNLGRNFLQNYKHDGINSSTGYSLDRFIPRRKCLNVDAAHHSLTTKSTKKESICTLELPDDLNNLGASWQKRNMARALEIVTPGAKHQRILQFSHNPTSLITVPGSLSGRSNNLDENYNADYLDEYRWQVKPRKRPVIGKPDMIFDIPNFRPSLRKNLLDWSSENLMAAAVDRGVCVVHANLDLSLEDTKFLFNSTCTAVKFSNSGEKIAIGRESSITSVYKLNSKKYLFGFQCQSTNHSFSCHPQAYAWSKEDEYLVAGCNRGYLEIMCVITGIKLKIIETSTYEVTTVSFSPNNRFIVTSGRESRVQIFTWPDVKSYMEIGYHAPVRAMAWHPWESSILCIGGGEADGGLSLWNIQCQKCLSYRSINFDGRVDTISWNKVTGEIVVNWFICENGKFFTAMPVYASFDYITDSVVPSLKNDRIFYTFWTPDGSNIVYQSKESVFKYKFLDEETCERLEKKKKRNLRERKENILSRFTVR